MAKAKEYFIGIDVGTGSARAGIFDVKGRRAGIAVCPITIWRPAPDFVEQSSENIWKAIRTVVRTAMKEGKISPGSIAGIGFDATCSLVVLDKDARPLTVSPTKKNNQNII